MRQKLEASANHKVVSLADYRQRFSSADDGTPPPSPKPASARRPPPPSLVEAVGWRELFSSRTFDGLSNCA
jgi:hypothetical protein